MDSHSNTSEEATSAWGTRSATDLVSEVVVIGSPPTGIKHPFRQQDRHPRDGPRDKSTDAQDEDHRGSINPRRKSRPPPTLAYLCTRMRTCQADT
ncbi:hypothetical protein B296_00014607 [Ensete ventricosum]|uniref:Uncharacterized protein n=1 Tax=Ensete ventricosum TaxID=4639 RepID=A0A427B272_ENSVE|nr:hypothetical protein B296_00014607 [Ensete ventricosum]